MDDKIVCGKSGLTCPHIKRGQTSVLKVREFLNSLLLGYRRGDEYKIKLEFEQNKYLSGQANDPRQRYSLNWLCNNESSYGRTAEERIRTTLDYLFPGYETKGENDPSEQATQTYATQARFTRSQLEALFGADIEDTDFERARGSSSKSEVSKRLSKTPELSTEVTFRLESLQTVLNISHLRKGQKIVVPKQYSKSSSFRIVFKPPYLYVYLGKIIIYPVPEQESDLVSKGSTPEAFKSFDPRKYRSSSEREGNLSRPSDRHARHVSEFGEFRSTDRDIVKNLIEYGYLQKNDLQVRREDTRPKMIKATATGIPIKTSVRLFGAERVRDPLFTKRTLAVQNVETDEKEPVKEKFELTYNYEDLKRLEFSQHGSYISIYFSDPFNIEDLSSDSMSHSLNDNFEKNDSTGSDTDSNQSTSDKLNLSPLKEPTSDSGHDEISERDRRDPIKALRLIRKNLNELHSSDGRLKYTSSENVMLKNESVNEKPSSKPKRSLKFTFSNEFRDNVHEEQSHAPSGYMTPDEYSDYPETENETQPKGNTKEHISLFSVRKDTRKPGIKSPEMSTLDGLVHKFIPPSKYQFRRDSLMEKPMASSPSGSLDKTVKRNPRASLSNVLYETERERPRKLLKDDMHKIEREKPRITYKDILPITESEKPMILSRDEEKTEGKKKGISHRDSLLLHKRDIDETTLLSNDNVNKIEPKNSRMSFRDELQEAEMEKPRSLSSDGADKLLRGKLRLTPRNGLQKTETEKSKALSNEDVYKLENEVERIKSRTSISDALYTIEKEMKPLKQQLTDLKEKMLNLDLPNNTQSDYSLMQIGDLTLPKFNDKSRSDPGDNKYTTAMRPKPNNQDKPNSRAERRKKYDDSSNAKLPKVSDSVKRESTLSGDKKSYFVDLEYILSQDRNLNNPENESSPRGRTRPLSAVQLRNNEFMPQSARPISNQPADVPLNQDSAQINYRIADTNVTIRNIPQIPTFEIARRIFNNSWRNVRNRRYLQSLPIRDQNQATRPDPDGVPSSRN